MGRLSQVRVIPLCKLYKSAFLLDQIGDGEVMTIKCVSFVHSMFLPVLLIRKENIIPDIMTFINSCNTISLFDLFHWMVKSMGLAIRPWSQNA